MQSQNLNLSSMLVICHQRGRFVFVYVFYDLNKVQTHYYDGALLNWQVIKNHL